VTSTRHPELVTAAEAARMLGVTRGRVLDLAASAADFPSAQRTSTRIRAWPRVAVQAWAATHPDLGPVFTGPKIPPFGEWPPQVGLVERLASIEAQAANHNRIGLDHLILGMLHPDCPGAARAVLESFGLDLESLRQALIDRVGEALDTEPSNAKIPATQLVLERANLEAASLADAEVASEHVLLALTHRWGQSPITGWMARHRIDSNTVRERVVELTEDAAVPESPGRPAPAAASDPMAGLDLARNPLGKDPRQRTPWGSVRFDAPLDRPPRVGMLARQYFVDSDGYPVLTTDGRPVHVVVDEQGMPLLDEQGRRTFGPVEIPPGCQVEALHEGRSGSSGSHAPSRRSEGA
jgi:predicted DNA-binding transcriptional regulator AlpA